MKSFKSFLSEALAVHGDAYQSTLAKIQNQEKEKKEQLKKKETDQARKKRSDDLRVSFLKGEMRGTHKGKSGTFIKGKFHPD